MGLNNSKQERVGEVSYSKYGTKATILDYQNNKRVLIEFDDDYKFRYFTSYINFKNGSITNPYDKSIYGVGFIGNGRYNSKHISYPIWFNMIKRCYGHKSYDNASYYDCSVEHSWHNFQNFAEWYEQNKYQCGEKLTIDKDVKIHGNRIYSQENCMLLPKRLNLLFIKEKARRGDLPIGVYYQKDRNNYVAMCSIDCKSYYIGSYKTPNEAFLHYKNFKKDYIKSKLREYINVLPTDIYKIIEGYTIQISD